MTDLNPEILRSCTAEIRTARQAIRGYLTGGKRSFLRNPSRADATRYRAIVGFDAAISLSIHLAVRRNAPPPTSYADCFAWMGQAGILSGEMVETMAQMARFRNLLVHVYWEVDDARVYDILSEGLPDFDRYIKEIGQALGEEL